MNSEFEKWDVKKLGSLCKTTSGGTPSRNNKEYYQGEIPWVKSGELNFNTINEVEESISEEAISESSAKVFPKGTLLIALYGATVGKLAFLGLDAATNQAVCAIMPKNGLDNKYLYWYLFFIKKDLVGKSIGGAQPNISQTILKDIDVPVPPIPTQHRIVEKIEELFSDLDNGVENLKKAKQQLETYKQSVLKAAFEGKLTKQWREQQEDLPTPEELKAEIEEERRRYREQQLEEWRQEVKEWEQAGEPGRKPWKPSKLDKINPINISELENQFRVPNGWIWLRTREIGEWNGGGTPKKSNSEYWENGSIPWVSPKDMKRKDISETQDYMTEKALENSSAKLVKEGSVLFVTRSGILRRILPVAISQNKLTVNQDLKALSVIDNLIPDYVYWYCIAENNKIRRQCMKGGTTVESIETNSLKNYPVPICCLKEQKKIVNEIESKISLIEQIEKTIDRELEKAKSLRQSILKKAFSGKLVEEYYEF